jgi:hypothetical protein
MGYESCWMSKNKAAGEKNNTGRKMGGNKVESLIRLTAKYKMSPGMRKDQSLRI